MSWFFWACIIAASSITYQLSSKVMAGQAPVFFITACTGLIITLVSCLLLIIRKDTLAGFSFDQRFWVVLVALGLASFSIEFGFNQMYRAGAPLALARILTTGGSALALIAIGVFCFSEKLSPYQYAGILLTLSGLVFMSFKAS